MGRINGAIKIWNTPTNVEQMLPIPDKWFYVPCYTAKQTQVVMELLMCGAFINKVVTQCLGHMD